MVSDIGYLRVKLMFSRGNYDTHSNKRKPYFRSVFWLQKLTRTCIVHHTRRRVALAMHR